MIDDLLDDDEIALVIEMRDRQSEQRRLRAQILTDLGEHVEVRCRLHLIDPDTEAMLVERLREMDDRLAVIRHCDSRGDGAMEALLAQTSEWRQALAAQLEAVVVELAVAIGRPPRGGDDWSASDVPAAALDEIAAAWSSLRRDLVRLVDHLVASDLVRALHASGGVVDVVLREDDADALARVHAFIAEARRLERIARDGAERVRHIALRAAHTQPRRWLAQNQLRSRQAREALDVVRALHAARAELELIAGTG